MREDEILLGHEVDTEKPVTTTIEDTIKNRTLFEGDSGSGKSHFMTVLIEGSDKKSQRLIIDIEGEYFPLKNNFEFLLIGKSNDTIKTDLELNLNDIYVDKLALKILEKSIDTIIDLSEYPNEATHFISILFKSILKHSKVMSRPLLIFVDEAHIFAPEKGSGNEESLRAVIEMAKRGRKRGIGIVCGTQAIADFSKNVVRQLRTRFIGNCNYDKDIKTACHYLGFTKEREHELTTLGDEHHFFVAGAGLKIAGKKPTGVIKIKAIATFTKLYDFKFDKKIRIKDVNPNAIRDLKDIFQDIPQEIEQELDIKEKLKIKVDELTLNAVNDKKTIEKLQKEVANPKTVNVQEIEKIENKFNSLLNQKDSIISAQKSLLTIIQEQLEILGESITKKAQNLLEETRRIPENTKYQKSEIPTMQTKITEQTESYKDGESDYAEQIELSGPENRILQAIVMRDQHSGTRNQIALLTAYSPNGGAFRNPLSRLKSLELIEYSGNLLKATEKGKTTIKKYNSETRILTPRTNEEIQSMWLSKLSGPEKKLLEPLIKAYPESVTKELLAYQTAYSPNGGAFRNPLSRLKSTGLIEYIGNSVRATKELFPFE